MCDTAHIEAGARFEGSPRPEHNEVSTVCVSGRVKNADKVSGHIPRLQRLPQFAERSTWAAGPGFHISRLQRFNSEARIRSLPLPVRNEQSQGSS
jgi:hypothetical protein